MKVIDLVEPHDVASYEASCKVMLHSRKVSVGEKILVRSVSDNLISGPLDVLEAYSSYAVAVASDEFNYYEGENGDELDTENLLPIFKAEGEYRSVTGNIFLDGFLRAAYYDEKGILRVDVSTKYQSLMDYYSSAMNECGIEFHTSADGFIIDSVSAVEAIFDSYDYEEYMPPKYVIGYLSSFIITVKVSRNGNPKYARYRFGVIPGCMDDDDVTSPGFFINQAGNTIHPLFGSFQPLSVLVDSVDHYYYGEEDVAETTITLRGETIVDLLILMFYYAGYAPIYDDSDHSMLVKNSPISDDTVTVGLVPDANPAYCPEWDYVIYISDSDVRIGKIEKGVCRSPIGLFNNPWFDFGREMSSYFEIMIRRL